jgi:hypothetical protein
MLNEVFAEWYAPDEDALYDIAKNGTIALDTNILTALYKFGATTRDKLLDIFQDEAVRTRLFMPYQAGLEYHLNRLKVARDQHKGYGDLIGRANEAKGALRKLVTEHSFRDEAVRDELTAAVDTALRDLNSKIETVRDQHVINYGDVLTSDPIRNSLNNIFREAHQVGTPPTEDERTAQIAEFETRYKAKPPVPPGYCDAIGDNKKSNPEGDFLIWCELRALATTKQDTPLLFVTDDQKEDWYLLDATKEENVVGPRPELVKEMATLTEQPYHQTNLTGFLELITTHLAIDLDESTVEEVRRATAVRSSPVFSTGVSLEPNIALQSFRDALANQNVRIMDSFGDAPKQSGILDFINSQDIGVRTGILDHLNSETLGVRSKILETINSQNVGLQGFYAGLAARDFITSNLEDHEPGATTSTNEPSSDDLDVDAHDDESNY